MRDDLIARRNALVLQIVDGVISEYRRLNGSGWFNACAAKVREALDAAALATQGETAPAPVDDPKREWAIRQTQWLAEHYPDVVAAASPLPPGEAATVDERDEAIGWW
jgi:hypothetical protein